MLELFCQILLWCTLLQHTPRAALPTWQFLHQSSDIPTWQRHLSKITSDKSDDSPVFFVAEVGEGGGADTIGHFSHIKWCESLSPLHVISEQRVLPRVLPKSQSTLPVSQMLHNNIRDLRAETTPRLQNEPQSWCTMLSVPSPVQDLRCFVVVC